ncbi:MAG: ubiquinone/menaquinone biosynthesis methyltransferase [Anaerolineae bacterium]
MAQSESLSFAPTGLKKAAYVRHMFALAARRYDLMDRLMTFGRDRAWRHFAAQLAQPPPGGLALDVATGTAELALALLKTAPTIHVVGVDSCPEMLAVGKRKVQGEAGHHLRFLAGDALRLPFPDGAFDCLVNGFVLRHVSDISQALAEMGRVVRPGGCVVCLEVTKPTLPLFSPLFRFYFYHLVPLLGSLISSHPPAYTYLPHSLTDFPSADELCELMERVRLQEVHYHLLDLGTVAVHVGTASGG